MENKKARDLKKFLAQPVCDLGTLSTTRITHSKWVIYTVR